MSSDDKSKSSSSSTSTKPTSLGGGGRLPSLNQLAARINKEKDKDSSSTSTSGVNPAAAAAGGAAPAAATAAARPRLNFALRGTTGSTTSVASSVATTNDSTAVNPSSTREGSPALSGSISTASEDGVTGGGEALTSEKLKELDQENTTDGGISSTLSSLSISSSSTPPSLNLPSVAAGANAKPQVKVGYKNIPSLDAIAVRLAKAREKLSVDGTSKPPEGEMMEDPKTPGLIIKKPEHPLQFTWTIYHDTKSNKFTPYTPAPTSSAPDGSFTPSNPGAPLPPESHDYEANLTLIGSFSTVESFCRYFNWLKPPSKLEKNSNYHLFKSGIKPMWEDPSNAGGGKWVLTMKNNPALLDRCWQWLCFALVGEELEDGQDEITGAVVSLRAKVDRIQVWTRGKEDVEKLNGIGKRLVALLDVGEGDGIGLEFQYNTDDRPLPNKFLSISALPSTSYRPSFNPSSPAAAHGPGHARGGSVNLPSGLGPNGGANGAGMETPPASAGPGIGGGGAFGSFGIGIGGGWRGAGAAAGGAGVKRA